MTDSLSSVAQSGGESTDCTREVQVLVPSSSTKPHHSASREPTDLKMSVEQARAYQASLSSRSSTSGPLLTKKLRDQAAMKKRQQLRPDKCRVKFKFGDGTQVISSFEPTELASNLYAFVRTVVVNDGAKFELEVPGDRKKIPDTTDELWSNLNFGAGVALQVIGTVLIKDDFKKQGKDVGQVVAQNDLESQPLAPVPETGSESASSSGGSKAAKKIPKWLQKSLGKK